MSSNSYSKYESNGSSWNNDYKKREDNKLSDDRRSPKRDWKKSSRSSSRDSYKPKRTTDYDKERSRDFGRDNKDFGNKWKSDSFAGASLGPVDWSKLELSPFKKNFYIEHKNVKERTEKETEKFRTEHRITIKSSWAPTPIFSFEEVTLPRSITESIQRAGYLKPTPIQSQGWPAALSGHDVIGIAQTGSGKTASFLIPAIVHINAQAPLMNGDGPIALVLAPTRELAMQIASECEKFARNSNLRSVCVYGGAEKYPQQRELQRGAHIAIACPGRLLDFLEMKVVNLRRVTYLVLDEADRMLDMGFEPQIRKILSQIRPDRQTLMWSATWPRDVQKMALDFCKEKPIHICIGDSDLAVNSSIKQNIEIVDESMKESRAVKLLENITDGSKILIFCQTKRACDRLADVLKRERYQAMSIHGDKSQSQRDYIMKNFKNGRSSILVATDLAARGLDVSDIFYVINYDFPMQLEDYIHRVGRTGRAGRKGISYTFFTRGNFKYASGLIDILEGTNQKVPNELYKMARRPIPLHNYTASSNEDEKPKYSNTNTNTSNNYSYNNTSESSTFNSKNSYSGTKTRFEFTSGPPTNSYNYSKPSNPPSSQYSQYQYNNSGSWGTQPNPPTVGDKNTSTFSSTNGQASGQSGSSNSHNVSNGISNSITSNGTHSESTSVKTSNQGANPFFNYTFMFPPPMMPTTNGTANGTTNGTSQASYTNSTYQNPMNCLQSNQNTQNLGVGGSTEKPVEGEKKAQ